MIVDENSDAPDNFANWRHLLFAAEKISELPNENLSRELQSLLNSLDEHFCRSTSPLEDFHAYSVRQFCKSISNVLYRIENPKLQTNLVMHLINCEPEENG